MIWIHIFDLDWIHIFDCSKIPFESFDGPEKGRFEEDSRGSLDDVDVVAQTTTLTMLT